MDNKKPRIVVLGHSPSLAKALARVLIASMPKHKVEVLDYTKDLIPEELKQVQFLHEAKPLRKLHNQENRGGSRKKGGRYKWPRR